MYGSYNFAHGKKTLSRRNFSKILSEQIAPVHRLAAIKRRIKKILWAKLCTWHITLPSQLSRLLVKILKFCFMVVVVWWSISKNNQVLSICHNSLIHKTQLKSFNMQISNFHFSIFCIFFCLESYNFAHDTISVVETTQHHNSNTCLQYNERKTHFDQ